MKRLLWLEIVGLVGMVGGLTAMLAVPDSFLGSGISAVFAVPLFLGQHLRFRRKK